MWTIFARLILRFRLPILIGIAILTAFFGYNAQFLEMNFKMAKLLPASDSTDIEYENFRNIFGEDGNVVVLGIQEKDIFQLNKFTAWYELGNQMKEIKGVEEVMSIAHVYDLKKNTSGKKFDFVPVVSQTPQTQEETDSLQQAINDLPFYEKLIHNSSTGATMMALYLDKKMVNSKSRIHLIDDIKNRADDFAAKQNIHIHFSGLPYIRTVMTMMLSREIRMFVLLSGILAAIILYLFFRSLRIVASSLLIVGIGVVWSFGFMVLFGYKTTILSGLIPSLIIIIGITNCIFLLNKYHREFSKNGNKIMALTMVVERIGSATFMTNATTAAGFGTFVITGAKVMQEFGIIASLNILILYFLSIMLIPIIFSYLPEPNTRAMKHLGFKIIGKIIDKLVFIVNVNRNPVYVITTLLLVAGGIGIANMETTGNMVDDVPHNHAVYKDLKFFEKNFGGVMPFEIMIDTKKKRGVINLSNLAQIEKLYEILASYPEFSRPISIVDAVKFSKQAFYNGRSDKYSLPDNQEKNFILPYATADTRGKSLVYSFVDSTKQFTRISVRMADIGTTEMQRIKNELHPKIDSLFNSPKYHVTLTGTSVIFLKGTSYLVNNLFLSLAFAVVIIAVLMAILFSSLRMVIVSLVPNMIPLVLTAAIMGYSGITIKPSTILVFSIAFGISVDNTIHFLAKFRQELKLLKGDIKSSVNIALREVGVSMIYTFVVLFFGFGIFIASDFGGTKSLGILITITLMLGVLANLIFLPSLILSFQKSITTKAFEEPIIDIFDEEEDTGGAGNKNELKQTLKI